MSDNPPFFHMGPPPKINKANKKAKNDTKYAFRKICILANKGKKLTQKHKLDQHQRSIFLEAILSPRIVIFQQST